jgi:DNA-binding CsgD family transcriptional regulator
MWFHFPPVGTTPKDVLALVAEAVERHAVRKNGQPSLALASLKSQECGSEFIGFCCFCRGRKMLTLDQELFEAEPPHFACKRSAARSMFSLSKEHRPTKVGRQILAQLSPKELCVANLLIVEGTNRAIAGKMGTSVETVKSHLVHIFHKVCVQDRLSLAMMLIRHGVVACPCLGALEHGQRSSVGNCALHPGVVSDN